MTWAMLTAGFNGGKEIKTPQIDRLAAAGAILEAHYVNPCVRRPSSLDDGALRDADGVYAVVRPHAKWGLR